MAFGSHASSFEQPPLVRGMTVNGGAFPRQHSSHAPNFFHVNTRLPSNPRVIDRSKLPNGKTPADYADVFSKLPKELESALRSKGNLEICLTIDETGKLAPVEGGSKNAPKAFYVGAMIKMEKNGSYNLVGIWGGKAGGGNNGAPAAMVTSKMMSTAQGREALARRPVIEAMNFQWGETEYVHHGKLNKNSHAWTFPDGRKSTFIPMTQGNTFGVHKQTGLAEHHTNGNSTWGCLSGNAESFRARMNARIYIMAGGETRIGSLGLQNTPSIAAKVFHEHKELAATTLGKVYQLNPLMYNTDNKHYASLAQKLNVTGPEIAKSPAYYPPHTAHADYTKKNYHSAPSLPKNNWRKYLGT